MLLQSHLNEIHLLAALPAAWKDGKVTGLKARGGFEVEIAWQDQQLRQATIRSLAGGNCTVRTQMPVKVADTKARSKKVEGGYLTSFATQKGKVYRVSATVP
jgi:alpha-L-fucosidase 2